MKITTIDIIKMLPFEEDFKKDLVENFDNLTADQKFNIERIVWGAYDALYQLKLEENLQIAFSEMKHNREKVNKDFYNRVRDLTDNQMAQMGVEDIKEMDLDIAREKLAEIMTSNSD
jgi:hypothetical protein